MLLDGLRERWGPLPAGVWVLVAAAALYWYARQLNGNPITLGFDVPTDSTGPSSPTDIGACCPACDATPNRLLGLLPHMGLAAPLVPWVNLTGGPNWANVQLPTALGDAERA